MQIAMNSGANDRSLALIIRTWRATIEHRYIHKQFQDTQWTELSFIRTVAAVALKKPSSILHRFALILVFLIFVVVSKKLSVSTENFAHNLGWNSYLSLSNLT